MKSREVGESLKLDVVIDNCVRAITAMATTTVANHSLIEDKVWWSNEAIGSWSNEASFSNFLSDSVVAGCYNRYYILLTINPTLLRLSIFKCSRSCIIPSIWSENTVFGGFLPADNHRFSSILVKLFRYY